MKTCSNCKKPKPYKEFYKNPGTNDGYGSQCNKCDAGGKRNRSRKRKAEAIEKMGGKCSVCGYNKCLAALVFHHNDGVKESIVSKLFSSPNKLIKELEHCIVLCSNCHHELHDSELPEMPQYNFPNKIVEHGTVLGYKRCKEKCRLCKKAWSNYMKELRS